MSNRILDYPEATGITSDDYILLDNAGTGAKCIKASALNINMDNYTIKEARGSIASFDDGEDLPLAFMGAYITANQDLHGYDYPWVGGAGKNKFNIATISVKEYIGENGNIYSSNNWSVSDFISVDSETAYVLSGITNSGSLAKHAFYDSNKVFISVIDSTVMNFTTPSNAKYIRLSLQSETPTNVQLEKGTTATSFAPYSNICPIIGWDEVNVTRCGVNVWDEEWEVGDIDAQGNPTTSSTLIRTKNYNPCKPNTTYKVVIPNNTSMYMKYYDKDKNFITPTVSAGATITTPNNCYYFKFVMGNAYGTTYNNDISINYPSTDTSYHAYNGNTYSLTFTDGSNPLTVYGGTVDLVSGVLTVDRGYVDLGTLDWQYSSIDEKFYARATPLGVKATDVSTPFNAISSALIAKSYNEIDAKTVDNAIGINPNATQFFARCSSITSASEFITAMNGVQLVYELATPLTIQLSPTIIYSLIGENNIFANTGDSIVDYRKLWVKPEM